MEEESQPEEEFSLDSSSEESEDALSFMEEESQPEEEFSFDSPSEESEEVMAFVEEDSQPEEEFSLDEFAISESEELDLNEAEESLEAAEDKIDVLNKISDESFQEINELLSSVQLDDSEEESEELQDLFQKNPIDN